MEHPIAPPPSPPRPPAALALQSHALFDNQQDPGQQVPSRMYLSPSGQETADSTGRSSSPSAGALSSQEFKDELKLKQSRLSPSQDASLSIDERIRLNKQRGTAMSGENHLAVQRQLPDSLLASSATLQRDKRPFAYSPDVSDPKNRGKLDLSHIKSPTMRRRLLANMESNSSGEDDDADANGPDREPSDGSRDHLAQQGPETSIPCPPENYSGLMHQDLNASRSNKVEIQPNRPLQPATSAHHREVLKMQHQQPPRREELSSQTPIVQYSGRPPILYDASSTRSDNYIIHLPEPATSGCPDNGLTDGRRSASAGQAPGNSADVNSLDREIVSSLASLSLMADNLERSVKMCNRSLTQQQQPHVHINNDSWTANSFEPTRAARRHDEQLSHQELQAARRREQITSTSHRQAPRMVPPETHFDDRPVPSFYSVLPSGRRVNTDPDASPWVADNPFATTTLPPQHVTYSPHDTCNNSWARAPVSTLARVNRNATSHGTFCHPSNLDSNPWPTNTHFCDPCHHHSDTLRHDQHHYSVMPSFSPSIASVPPLSTEHYHAQLGRPHPDASSLADTGFSGARLDSNHRARVEALREMTAQLEREVNRLYSIGPPPADGR